MMWAEKIRIAEIRFRAGLEAISPSMVSVSILLLTSDPTYGEQSADSVQ